MKKLNILLLVLISFCTAVSAGERTYRTEIGQFDRLRVLDNVNVVYRCVPDSTGLIVYRGEDDFADSFIFSISNSTLRIQVTTEDVGKPGLPTLYVYSDFLTSVESSSDFHVAIDSLAPVPEFKAVQIGNGSISVDNLTSTKTILVLNTGKGSLTCNGTTTSATLKMIGTGLIQADSLKAKNVNCKIAGSGSIGCWPQETLKVSGIGSTKIYYKGSPEIKKKGGGKLIPINSIENE